jgi:uncharacterized SAM-binding protein YcdF (DUF218 family)
MILRLTALVVMLYALGFVLFAVTLGDPAGPARSDAIIVLTGGAGRIERGIAVMRRGDAERMLVAGADPSVTRTDLIRRLQGDARLVRCCVDLGSESVDTRSNAEEALRWIDRHKYRSVRLITSDWHMHRAAYEFRKQLGPRVALIPDPLTTQPRFMTLFGEYNKYVLRRISMWLGL